MSKRVKQFRFYNTKSPGQNNPQNLTLRSLISGSAFSDYMPITQLGI